MDSLVKVSSSLESYSKKTIACVSTLVGTAIGIILGSLIGIKGLIVISICYFLYRYLGKNKEKSDGSN